MVKDVRKIKLEYTTREIYAYDPNPARPAALIRPDIRLGLT